jgi:hypothetical protein
MKKVIILHDLVYFGKQVILWNAWLNSLDDINGPRREATLCVVAQDYVKEAAWSKFVLISNALIVSSSHTCAFSYVWAVLRTWRHCRKLVPHSWSPVKCLTVSQCQQIILICSRPERPVTITMFKSSNWLPRPISCQLFTHINSYNKSQKDALFFKFILIKNSTCFGQIYCPPSGVSTLYTQH